MTTLPAPSPVQALTGGRQRAQALVETAVVLPVLLLLALGFALVTVLAQAWVEVDTATGLAAAAAVSARANDDAASHTFALKTYQGTLRRSPYLEPGSLEGCGGYASGSQLPVTCTGSATVYLSRTPMALLQPWNSNWTVQMRVSASSYPSRYRST